MSLPFRRLTDSVYRGHNPRWSFTPESGDGAKLHGGRFNPKGLSTLYTSYRPETAWLEAQQGFAFKAQPLTLCAYAVDCTDILDLTDPAVCKAASTKLEDLSCDWEHMMSRGITPPTWALTARLLVVGCAGIVVPSFAKGATDRDLNVVFWTWSRTPPHQVRVIDDEGPLPKDERSWL